MKSIIRIAVAVFIMTAAVPGMAQGWNFTTLPADELLDREAMDAAVYTTEDFSCVISFTHDCIMVTSNDGIFDYHKREYWVHIGLYDTIGNIVEKYRQFCYGDLPVDHTVFRFTNNEPLFGKKRPQVVDRVIEWLASGNGYVRIVAPRFQQSNMEIILLSDKRFKEWEKK